MDQLLVIINLVGSMMGAVIAMGTIGFVGAWLMTRNEDCNPYGYNACACGCGTNCGDAQRG